MIFWRNLRTADLATLLEAVALRRRKPGGSAPQEPAVPAPARPATHAQKSVVEGPHNR